MDIRLVITDVDGVWTDDGMYYSAYGDELKKFNTSDSVGVLLLRAVSIPLAVLTGEHSPIVLNRAKKLSIEHVIMGSKNKLQDAILLCDRLKVSVDKVAFIGNDLGDMQLLRAAGISAVPFGTPPYIAQCAQRVMRLRGGEGVFREFVEVILQEMMLMDKALAAITT